jgi:N-acetylmuramoyl-L-alanine amidase
MFFSQMFFSHQYYTGSILLLLLILPLFIASCAVIGGRPKGVGLAGKRIVLDPGHGGEHLGAVGLNGLEEKTTNLWVGQKLKKMLETDGARVYMTRERDDQTISLQDRVTFTKEKKADLFVSLHHNANAQVDRTIDRSEVYYYWWNDGPSRDIANRLYAAFHRHLGLPQLPARPAIYYVTRHNDEPCLLGEPSYISNPEREAKLKTGEHQQEEAQAYYEAIKEYFEGGIPRIEEFHINADVAETGILTVRALLRDEEGGSGIDPATIELKLDEQLLAHHFDPHSGQLTASSLQPLKSGPHDLFLMVRNRRGNAAKPVRQDFSVDLPPASLQLNCKPRWAPVKGTFGIQVWATVGDPGGHPVTDGKTVTFVADRGAPSTSSDTTRAGRAGTFLTVKEPKGKSLIFATCENLYDRVEVQFDSTCGSLVSGTVLSGWNNEPVGGAWVRLGEHMVPAGDLGHCLAGHFLIEGVSPGPDTLEVHCRGHFPHQGKIRVRKNAGLHQEIILEPLYGGLLLDKAVAIDAEAGGDDTGGIGPGGTKASDVNLRVAQYLKEYLEAGGATVHMTRGEFVETLDPVTRTRFVRDLKPNKLVSISHQNPYMDEDGARCFHFYTDQEGKALAERVQKHLVSYLGSADLGVHEWSSYLMIEAYVDRALVTPAIISDAAAEERLRDPVRLRREAYAIFCGLLEDFGLEMETTGSILGVVTDESGTPLKGALVILDGAFALQTGPDGVYRFVCVEAGKRTVSIHRDGYEMGKATLKVHAQKETTGDIRLVGVK